MANNTRQIRRQIKSIKNTAKITRAMEMISAVKLQKTQAQTLASRAYSDAAKEVLEKLTLGIETKEHKLFATRPVKTIGAIVFSANRGLCGSLNSNIAKTVLEFEKNISQTNPQAVIKYITLGKKIRDIILKLGKVVMADFSKPDVATNNLLIIPVADMIIKEFIAEQLDQVVVIFPKSISVVNQKPILATVLPFSADLLNNKDQKSKVEQTSNTLDDIVEITGTVHNKAAAISYIFEPSPEYILGEAIFRLIETQIYQALLETNSAEHAARMVAMKSATDNARDLESDLSLFYNRTRQSVITQEVSEITAGRLALVN